MGEAILVIGDLDGSEFPVGQVVQTLQLAVGQHQDGHLLVLLQRLLRLLIEFANINFA